MYILLLMVQTSGEPVQVGSLSHELHVLFTGFNASRCFINSSIQLSAFEALYGPVLVIKIKYMHACSLMKTVPCFFVQEVSGLNPISHKFNQLKC